VLATFVDSGLSVGQNIEPIRLQAAGKLQYLAPSASLSKKFMQAVDETVSQVIRERILFASRANDAMIHAPLPKGGLGFERVFGKYAAASLAYLARAASPGAVQDEGLRTILVDRYRRLQQQLQSDGASDVLSLQFTADDHRVISAATGARYRHPHMKRPKEVQLVEACHEHKIGMSIRDGGLEFAIDGATALPHKIRDHIRKAGYDAAYGAWARMETQRPAAYTELPNQPGATRHLQHHHLEPMDDIDDHLCRTVVRARLDLLPTGKNLNRWKNGGISDKCPHCDDTETIEHLLGGCEAECPRRMAIRRHNELQKLLVDGVNALNKKEQRRRQQLAVRTEEPVLEPRVQPLRVIEAPTGAAAAGRTDYAPLFNSKTALEEVHHYAPDVVMESSTEQLRVVDVIDVAVTSDAGMHARFVQKEDRYTNFAQAVEADHRRSDVVDEADVERREAAEERAARELKVTVRPIIVSTTGYVHCESVEHLTELLQQHLGLESKMAKKSAIKILRKMSKCAQRFILRFLSMSKERRESR